MFSRTGEYPAVGLFTKTHIVSIVVCFLSIGIIAWFTRKMSKKTYFKCLKIFAVVLTALELVKIITTFIEGASNINSWVPLFFCSLFMYALWLTYFKNKFLKELGLSYIAVAGIVAGSVFIIMPTTSFSWYPIFHFRCLYSMIYHSIMVYSGIMLFVTGAFKLNIKNVFKYCVFCLIFMAIAQIVNINFRGNLMFLEDPNLIPIPLLYTIYNISSYLYTAIIIIAHLLLGFVIYGIAKFCEFIKSKRSVIEIEEEIENKPV